jgi:hypothetical protein
VVDVLVREAFDVLDHALNVLGTTLGLEEPFDIEMGFSGTVVCAGFEKLPVGLEECHQARCHPMDNESRCMGGCLGIALRSGFMTCVALSSFGSGIVAAADKVELPSEWCGATVAGVNAPLGRAMLRLLFGEGS